MGSLPRLLPQASFVHCQICSHSEIQFSPLLPPTRPVSSTRSNAVNRPKGFGPKPSFRRSIKRKPKKGFRLDEEEEGGQEDEEDEKQEKGKDEDTIPEVVTNRMMRRMGLSVGIPLSIGLFFFPFFYYLKVVLKLDVPSWIPFFVSFFFFGASLIGVSYGIVSSSWDPLREGSLLGWNEARRNWPVFWQSIWGGGSKK
ncbi:hypothetical protein HPP92_024191 [Vanilla planifolia]|uniref:Protein PAM68, chloroplastic n=1 Tax=Vanilla planifolia TaxID=51239 RepID=A0A835PPA1_VANPL|nr:hypothetical protein HPP92_024191 [Vanilla planifolia]